MSVRIDVENVSVQLHAVQRNGASTAQFVLFCCSPNLSHVLDQIEELRRHTFAALRDSTLQGHGLDFSL